ncbi:excinuclease ABC subunit UvrC [Helicobacter ibis]|uniref:UvrABC system protein C n=1 Tax=Helicobacter ibis TaxID=2962633 RepID=A0ABT4VEQ2_9HELI|nr:excinuclease ABC subunit UvrC [Helicobacter ibis]MDA3968658.1 excinuclease ABC subunit UvrC [Helicobacter ibis]
MVDLLESIKSLPNKSGVYQYHDKDGRLLYVGKAKNLKNRVKSYFRFTPYLSPAPNLSQRIIHMLNATTSLRYIVLENEHDALILENSLIKQLKPKYNILLRDDKTYPYLCVNLNEEFPRIYLTRKVLKDKNLKYYGPYTTGARALLDSIYESFLLIQKESCLKGKKACLFYQIKKCLAPCEGKVTKEDYSKILSNALECIDNPKKILKILEEKMNLYSQAMRYEEAMIYRDRIQKIQGINKLSMVEIPSLEDLDVFAFLSLGNKGALVKFFIRNGKIVSSTTNTIKSQYEINELEIYTQALINYYSLSLPFVPKKILVPFDFGDSLAWLEDFLQNRFHKKIQIINPKSGDKKRLCTLALSNAQEALRISNKDDEITKDIQELFSLQNRPYRIEVFDTSHHKGEQCVGAMVVYDDRFIKEDYRHYLLHFKDEYSQMREMLSRRIESFSENPPPDLWVLDGGVGQINIALELLKKAGVNLEVVSISKEKLDSKAYRAKGRANDILRSKDGEYKLVSSDRRLMFIQKLRDEAHRFAITFHQKQKQKTMQQSKLLEIKGIGKATQKRLLDYFGDFESVHKASLKELEIALGEQKALAVYEALSSS